MLATPHLLTGAAIASSKLPAEISLPLAFLSHFLLDAIPHTEPSMFLKKYRRVPDQPCWREFFYASFDFACGILLLFYLFFRIHNVYLFWGGLAAIGVDLMDNIPFWFFLRQWPIFQQIHQLHRFFHYQLDQKYGILGILSQLILIIALLYFLL